MITSINSTDSFELALDQRAALDLTDNRVISASAGTGKTHTLCSLYVGLLAGRIIPGGAWLSDEDAWLKSNRKPEFKPRAIVVVTFTRKAAAELLARAQQSLERLLQRDDLPMILKEHLRQCREEFSFAPVCTIDAFCSRLLREAGMSSPAPIAFATLEEHDANELLEEALRDAATQLLEDDSNEQLKRLTREWGVFGEYGLISKSKTLLMQLRTRGLPPSALIKETYSLPLAQMRERFQSVLAAIRNVPDGRSKPSSEIRALYENPPPLTDEDCIQRAVLQLSALLWGSKDKYKWVERANIEDPAPDILTALRIPLVKALSKYLERGLELYTAAKRRRSAADFNDLLLWTRQLLQENPQVASGYRFLLIDEFQDTNPLQSEILRRIAFGESGAPQNGEVRLAIVGDRKQSIYRFRSADAQLMTQAEKEFATASLQESFRSRKSVLDFVNDLFSAIGDFSYDKTDCLKEQTLSNRHAWQGPPAELLTYTYTDKIVANQHRWQQARVIAKRIRCLVGAATESQLTRPQIWDKREQRLRFDARYSDIAILARSIKHIRIPLQMALSQMGIPFRMMGGASFYTRPEVLDIANLLACVVDTNDNLAITGFLRSPFVGLSDGALWRLVFDGQERAAKNLYSRLREAAAGPAANFAVADYAAICQAARLLTDLRAGLGRRAAAELIDKACAETGFLSVLAMLPQGEVAVAAARRVIELSRDFEARQARHLSDFVVWLKEKADAEWDDPGRGDNPDLSANLPEVEDAVQIGTIHSAKGLEFPIVILVDIGAKKTSPYSNALYAPETGLGLKLSVKKEGFSSVADSIYQKATELEKKADVAELTRLLYVAITRAREYVIFSGEMNSKDKDANNWRNLIGAHQQKMPHQIVATPHNHPELLAAQVASQNSALLLDSGTPLLRDDIAAQIAQVPDAMISAVDKSLLARRDLRVNVTWLSQWLANPHRAALMLNALIEASLSDLPTLNEDITEIFGARASCPHEEDADETSAHPGARASCSQIVAFDEEEPKARALGVAAHVALETIFAEPSADLIAVWSDVCARQLIDARNPIAVETLENLRRLVNSPWAKQVSSAPPEKRFLEMPFRRRAIVDSKSGSTVVMSGALDLLYCMNGDRWQLVDYKLTKQSSLTEERCLRYIWQTRIYAMIAAEILQVALEQIDSALIFLGEELPQPISALKLLSNYPALSPSANNDANNLDDILRQVWSKSIISDQLPVTSD